MGDSLEGASCQDWTSSDSS